MKWDDLRIFLAIARSGTLTGAGRVLGVHQSTVSRQLHSIEARLGVRLFDREASGYELNAAGSELLITAENVEEEFAQIDRRVFGRDARLSGQLTVTCTDNFLNHYLADQFARFAERYPQIDLKIITRYQHLSLARREADVAIRTTTNPADTLIGRYLLNLALAVYAAKSVVEKFESEPDPSLLNWIGWDSEAYNRLMITPAFPTAEIRYRVDSLVDMHSLACAGLGVAVLGCFSADTDPALRRVYKNPIKNSSLELRVLYHPDVRRAARVKAFTAFIADAILADRALFEGLRPQPWSVSRFD